MRTPIAIVVLCLGCVATAEAEELPPRIPDIEAGRALTASCVACHGEDGNSLVSDSPSIAGQNARYLLRQLQLFRDGERQAPLMIGQLEGRMDEQLEDIAAFYESQTSKVGQAPPAAAGLGQAIYRGGILRKGVAACTACHAPDGSGNPLAGFPALSGQQAKYVVAQLKAYREEERTSDEEYGGMMRQTAANMTDGEMQAVADYLHGLH